ncbi:DUF1708-domain-containing protein [Massarina eburnea CBS 473.64]|uniref:DUF1708-domain-containing protein n=1 Tax=Massarina eburnea CBS 473.64 TaxID=1395130 RepID=A0A6A6RMX4_9PLEO|nr:DUF1708-domain-containing protein [Massarina eburnea CBS 473.64]
MPFFKNVFKSKDGPRSGSKADKNDQPAPPKKPNWEQSWSRKDVAPHEIQELVHVCTRELKARGLDTPFILLPFRPSSDPSAARNFIRNFFKAAYEGTRQYEGESLAQEVRLAEPLTLCSIVKWCWSRLPGGVVSWDAYELFRTGESDSNFARHSFDTFIPLSVESEARKQIIFDFFDLLAAIAARSKSNGMGGRKLSRMAGWWAFEFTDDGKGFDGGYRTWEKAADASSHLFFAYLRSLAPDVTALGGISNLPRSLQSLLTQTEYPPQTPVLMQISTSKIVMIVNSVSPTPFALLRRAKNFEYRDDDEALQAFAAYEDTVTALTEECRRVLGKISSANQSMIAEPTALSNESDNDPSWSRFEDLGFSGILDSPTPGTNGTTSADGLREFSGMRSGPQKTTDFGRPTTPSWADFLSTGFPDENNQPNTLLSPSARLPPIGEGSRVHSSQSHLRNGLQVEEDLEPGELASITRFDFDETFWWVWMTSLAGEETSDRKGAFGRCTLIETRISGAKWLVVEEQVKGASPGPEEGAYIAEKKSMFSWTKRGRLGRSKSTGKKPTKEPYNRTTQNTPMSKTSIGPDQQARVQAAAAQLAKDQRDKKAAEELATRRGRRDDAMSTKTNSVMTLQPHLLSDAGPAMKWDKKFGEGAKDRSTLRAHYLGDINAGRGSKDNLLATANGTSAMSNNHSARDLPALPASEKDSQSIKAAAPPAPAAQPTRPSTDAISYAESSSAGRAAIPPAKLEERPGPTPDLMEQHPALRKPVPERKVAPTAAPAQPEARPSEEQASAPTAASKKIAAKKLKKEKGGGSGFRKLFGRKKAEAANAERSASRVESHHDGASARGPSPSISLERPPPIRAASPDAISAISATYNEPALQVAPNPSTQQKGAGQAFNRFDQGPMEEMPAFVPEDSDSDDAAPTVPRHAQAPVESTSGHPSLDDVSEESVDLALQEVPSQDRWAQIRKNAADRAARLSEEQHHRRSVSQSVRTDEGETSGEETIESRVARIKARVAELTGNADGTPAADAKR